MSGLDGQPTADAAHRGGRGSSPGGPAPGEAEASAPSPAYLDMAVGRFLDALSATTPDPGGGSTAALAVTLAAGLCVMTAGLSARHLPAADQVAAQARLLRDRAAPLAQADAEAYRHVLAALRAPGTVAAARQSSTPTGPPSHSAAAGPSPTLHNPQVAAALSQASAVPMEVIEIGAAVAAVAAAIATGGNPNVRGDAIIAALLAAAGARAAATLVRINLTGAEGDDRPARAEQLAAEAARLAAEAEAEAR